MNPNKPRRHNAKRLPFAKLQAIIYALANNDSIESIRRTYHVSRHTVHAVRNQCAQEIEAARERIRLKIGRRCCDLVEGAMNEIEQQIKNNPSLRGLMKASNFFIDTLLKLEAPVQTHPQPLSIKLAALRRAKRDKLSVPSA